MKLKPIDLLILAPRMSARSFSIASSLNSDQSEIKLIVKNMKITKDEKNLSTFVHGIFSNQVETLHNTKIK